MTVVLLLLASLAAVPAPAPATDAAAPSPLPIRRFALVAGANDGGPERVRLRYARSDAERVADVLVRLGGVARSDEVVLLDPDLDSLRQAFRAVEGRIRAARAMNRAELVVYYSGHSDENGLLLRGTRLPYDEVRRWLESVGAQVRIAIFDSCSSGALTRRKGGQRAAPFLVDTSSAVKGHAILTSSAADEASQESDRIGASFFTHFLVSGLRGAADASLDGKVTVNEAYQFAFSETLARTERTSSGAQHATYDIQLAGSGDVVLTDLRGTEATLLFPEQASGRFFVRDREGRLVAELRKVAGRPIELGIEPGAYRVVREDGDRLGEMQVTVSSGERAPIPLDRVIPIRREPAAVRGGELAHVPVDLALFPPLSLNGDRSTLNHVQLGLVGSRTTQLQGFGFAMALWAEEDVAGMQLAAFGASAGGRVDGAQLSGIASFAGSARGVQLASILNAIRGDLAGLQLGGVASWLGGHAAGAQVSPVVNVAGGIDGAQLGTVNVAGGVLGAQLGPVNVATHLRGAQLGVVNVATGPTVRGWQIGIVNVSKKVDGGLPLGIVNVVQGGWHRLMLVSDEDGNPVLAWAGGTGVFHTTAEVSLRRIDGEYRPWGAIGPGVHFELGRLGLDLDLLVGHVMDGPAEYGILTLRALATVPLSGRVALVVGPTLNGLGGDDRDAAKSLVGPWGELTDIGGRPVWLGMQAGLRL